MSMNIRTRLTANVYVRTPQPEVVERIAPVRIDGGVCQMSDLCFYCRRTKGKHLGDADQLYCDLDAACSFSPMEPGIQPPRRLFRVADAMVKAVVVFAALYLAMEVIYAFANGAVERLVR